MDHTMMDHSKMDHGHMGHGDMGAAACSMNMYLNADIKNLCILTEKWHITGVWSLLQSCIIIILFAMLFEFIRERIRRYEAGIGAIDIDSSQAGTVSSERATNRTPRAIRQSQMIKAFLYAFQVAVSYILMLVFMTFNVYVMAAVVIGAGLGHYFFNTDPASIGSKSMACH
ncbi:Ctr copper transporter family-domain-containing protein [Protomyces lactucae-debilis]|uniref:Copper transport protein n=1 Tax=Protomyces lactucae-debilis TaxID=2754530 RepID=A0A1Y2F010_PROLT|nr:Ctr copper transporter family-domain-containing protein [Protomyces lactucae-debilis]ORY76706.1 Ctr copper transporter family-domain-containing protein [Protomyces lactucae-debilis]